MAEITPGNSDIRKNSGLLAAARITFLVAVAVVIYLLARSCNDSRTRLEATRISMTRERDSLIGEFNTAKEKLFRLMAEKDTLLKNLESENQKNMKLAEEKAAGTRQLARSKVQIAGQSQKISLLNSKNDSLMAALSKLQARMEELGRQMTGMEKQIESKNSSIAGLNDSLKDRDRQVTTYVKQMTEQHLTDSMKTVPLFVIGGELDGGWGMHTTDVPFSKYFAGGSIVAGMEFNRRFFGGIGTGAYIFNGGTLMPIFLEFRYGFPSGNWTPYIYSKGGPLLNFSSYDRSNLFLNAGIGLRHQISDNFAFNFGTGLLSHNSGVSGRDSFLNLNLGIIYTGKTRKAEQK